MEDRDISIEGIKVPEDNWGLKLREIVILESAS